MAYPVVLYFDPDTQEKLQKLGTLLWAKGIEPGVTAKPHITVGGWEEIDLPAFIDALNSFAARNHPLPLNVEAVGTFPGEQGVVFFAFALSAELLRLHATFHQTVGRFGTQVNPFYAPDRWVPHCTVAMNLEDADIRTVVDACRHSDLFGPVELVEIALLKYPPLEELCVCSLERAEVESPGG